MVDENGIVHYSCYSKYEYFEIVESTVVNSQPHILGDIPIIEYPLNLARIGAFELVIPLLDAINTIASNRIDGVETFPLTIIRSYGRKGLSSSRILTRN